MYAFEDLEAVHSALNHLMRREPPVVKVLPRQTGTKESRYMHLLAGDCVDEVDAEVQHGAAPLGFQSAANSVDEQRIAELEHEVADLKRELKTLREQFASFQKQFQ
jgi:uncharacterized protein YceH (UPF0502 family)